MHQSINWGLAFPLFSSHFLFVLIIFCSSLFNKTRAANEAEMLTMLFLQLNRFFLHLTTACWSCWTVEWVLGARLTSEWETKGHPATYQLKVEVKTSHLNDFIGSSEAESTKLFFFLISTSSPHSSEFRTNRRLHIFGSNKSANSLSFFPDVGGHQNASQC
jgi:hypothetical protein